MGSEIDRLIINSRPSQPRKLFPISNRYLAKSKVINCKAENIDIRFANFRGSQFSNVSFKNCTIWGCDFYGTVFSRCTFKQTSIKQCNFVACTFKNCSIVDSSFVDSIIVTSHVPDGITISNCEIMKQFPRADIDYDLFCALETLAYDQYLRRYKLLFIGENKYNGLAILLLQRRFGKTLSTRLIHLRDHSTRQITTIEKMKYTLSKC